MVFVARLISRVGGPQLPKSIRDDLEGWQQHMKLVLEVTVGGETLELAVRRLHGREAISSLFHFTVDVVRKADEPLPEKIAAGAASALVFSQDDGQVTRTVYGMLAHVAATIDGDGSGSCSYSLSLVPRAWRSTLITTQQVFMDLSVPELIQKKLGMVGLPAKDINNALLESYPTREFIVQYQENDVDFIGRLAEHLGISFYFDHSSGRDRIVFTDYNGGFLQDDAIATIHLSRRLDEPNSVYRLRRETTAVPRLYVAYDYNYRKPDLSLTAQQKVDVGYGGGIVEYGCHAKSLEESQQVASIRADELRCRQLCYSGVSSIPLLSAGLRTSFEGSDQFAGELLITEVDHKVEVLADGTLRYSNSFEALSAAQTFRPQRKTPKPSISGFVTGVVQGVAGADSDEYAAIDEEGRYTVQFHFDSVLGKLNAKASRPVRMAQPFTGTSEGMHFPLKPGVEVAIAFANGDPDRPIIIGALPNHTTRSVVTNTNSTVNRIETSSGLVIQFGSS